MNAPRQFPEHSSCLPPSFGVVSVHFAFLYNLHGLVVQPSIRSSWRNWHLVLIQRCTNLLPRREFNQRDDLEAGRQGVYGRYPQDVL